MNRIRTYFAHPIIMGVLFIVLAFAMGVATFIENDYGSTAAKAIIYNSWWFEALFLLLAVNMIFRLSQPGYWKRDKISVILFHFTFLIIVLGAAITRYVGEEGVMHIREGESSNHFLSADDYIWGYIDDGQERVHFEQKVFLSPLKPDGFHQELSIQKTKLNLQSVVCLNDVERKAVPNNIGSDVVSLMISEGQAMEKVDLAKGDVILTAQYSIGFCANDSVDFNIIYKDNKLTYTSKYKIETATMKLGSDSIVSDHEFKPQVLYRLGDVSIVPSKIYPHALFTGQPVRSSKGYEAVIVKLSVGDEVHDITLFKMPEGYNSESTVFIHNTKLVLNYGAKPVLLPFAIHLNQFHLERYPGSESPSSFKSSVTVLDDMAESDLNYQIFMNNILNYRGYRFYQSSYDADEKGTVLSVNNDLWGTGITYLGYGLLALFLVLSLLSPKSRFRLLSKKLTKLNSSTLLLLGFLFCSSINVHAQIGSAIAVTEQQADAFGKLWIQDGNGRIKPVNTLSNEVLRKLVKHNSFKGYGSDQVFLSIMLKPELWQKIPLITVKTKAIREVLNCTGRKASYEHFFDEQGNYKLAQWVGMAYRTIPAHRDKFQNELIKIDEQVNVFYLVQSKQMLHLFPNEEDVNQLWKTPMDSDLVLTPEQLMLKNAFQDYLESLSSGNQNKSKLLLEQIISTQNTLANKILPSSLTKEVEIFYNETNLFLFLAPLVFLIGLGLLLVQLIYLLIPYSLPKWLSKSANVVLIFIFSLYTIGLLLRWFIAKHAPWSNGYESMLYVGWTIILAGVLFSKRLPIVLSVSSAFAGVVLFVAHLSWMNPEITALVPVLKSYWLTIHVAIIVASYGFLSLGALLSFTNLILMGIQKDKSDNKVIKTIKELSYVSEMSLTVGVYALTIGSFIGGVWANESWGRYWGWDPKETWSMITIFIYAFVLHMRMMPFFKGKLAYNIAAVLAFSSVVMTYLGVNYYLTGMHSYGSGDPLPRTDWLFYVLITLFVIILYAIVNQRKLRS